MLCDPGAPQWHCHGAHEEQQCHHYVFCADKHTRGEREHTWQHNLLVLLKAAVQSPTGQCTAAHLFVFLVVNWCCTNVLHVPKHWIIVIPSSSKPPTLNLSFFNFPFSFNSHPPFFVCNCRHKLWSQYPLPLPSQITIVTARVIPIFISFTSKILNPIIIPIIRAIVITIVPVGIVIDVPNCHLSQSLVQIVITLPSQIAIAVALVFSISIIVVIADANCYCNLPRIATTIALANRHRCHPLKSQALKTSPEIIVSSQNLITKRVGEMNRHGHSTDRVQGTYNMIVLSIFDVWHWTIS